MRINECRRIPLLARWDLVSSAGVGKTKTRKRLLAKYCISPSLPPRPEGGWRIFCFSPSADVNKQHFPPPLS